MSPRQHKQKFFGSFFQKRTNISSLPSNDAAGGLETTQALLGSAWVHLAFGAGVHHCLGANLACMGTRICMEAVLRRLPEYQLVETELQRIPGGAIVQGYLSVPVRFSAGG